MAVVERMRRAWEWCTAPHAEDEDTARQEFMTKASTLSVSLIAAFFSLLTWTGYWYGLIPADTPVSLSLTVIVFAVVWYLARVGKWRPSGYLASFLPFAIALYGNCIGGIDAPAMLLYALAVVVSALLQGGAMPLVMLGLSLVAYVGTALAHKMGYLQQVRSSETAYLNRVTIVVIILIAIAMLLDFLVRQLQKSITQSRLLAAQAHASAESLAIFKALADNAVDAFCICDSDRRLTYVNHAFCRLFGCTEDTAVGVRAGAYVPAMETTASGQKAASELPDAWNQEASLLRKGQEPFDADLAIFQLHDVGGKRVGMAAIIRDVTERNLAQDALRRSEAKYRELVQNANSIILRLDREGHITFFNEFAERFFGFREEDVLGRSILGTIIPPVESTGRDMALFVSALCARPEDFASCENENVRSNGERVWVAWTNKPIYDDAGRTREILCVGNDITERRRMEVQLRQAQKMEAVGQLAGGVAHDFNNILQAILGYGELMRMSIESGTPPHGELDEVLKAAQRAALLTRQLLAFSRKQVIELEPLALNDVVDELSNMIRRVIGEHIELVFVPDSKLKAVRADRGQVEQVLMNLCVNARDAMPNGGRLTLETSNVTLSETDCVAYEWVKPGKFVLLRVTDTGCGMDIETLGHVFEPFFTTKEMGKGTGLGLATVYGIVKQHEGFVNVQSAPGAGTSFCAYLPAFEAPAPATDITDEQPVAGGHETILFAEDEEQIRVQTRRILEAAGYTVLAAVDGHDALNIYRDNADKIDLLLLDAIMPKTTGKSVYETIREMRPDMRCVFSSGYSEDSPIGPGPTGNAPSRIQKPYRANDLLRLVRKTLDS